MKLACATIMTLASGRTVDLLDPQPADVDFHVFAHQLAQLNRYGGAAREPYSVAEHTVRGVEAIMRWRDDRPLAAAFLLHDFHEAVLGDAITPLKRALSQLALNSHLAASDSLGELYRMLAYRWDAAIHSAAGVTWPLPITLQQRVERWDVRMLRTEWRDLMVGEAPFAWPADLDPLPDRIGEPMGWERAKIELQKWCLALLPALAEVQP
jgi:hypothetical protein